MSRPTLREGQIKFTDGTFSYTLELVDGINGLRETGSQPSTLNVVGGGQRYGDFEPNFSHFEQRTFSGGRGLENYIDDKTRFYDSENAHTWGDEVFPAPIWRYARGLRDEDRNLSDSMTFKGLYGNTRYLDVAFAASASYSADKAYLWIRRIGDPGTLTLELCTDSGGSPDTVSKTVTKTITNITDTISVFQVFDWTTTSALTSGTTYHLKIYGASTDNVGSHWEVGCDTATAGLSSAAGSSWTATTYSPCYRIVDADTRRKWLFYVLEGALYAVSDTDSWGNSVVYINGDRGTASAGAATSITDSGKSWTASRYIGAWVKIIAGTGMGQARQITANTTTALTVATWDRNPDNTSRYVIYKTPWFSTTCIGTHGLGRVKSVCTASNIAYFAQGTTAMRRCQSNADTHDWAADGANVADILYGFYDAADGPQVWKVSNSTMTAHRASATAWGTNLSFSSGTSVGAKDYLVTGMVGYNNAVWFGKEDSLWTMVDDRASPLDIGLYGLPSNKTGVCMASQGLFLYFSWWKSLERLYGGTLDDVGMWKGSGLPAGKDGSYCAIAPLLSWMFCGIDAGSTGTSGVYIYKDGSYHNCYTAPYGERIRNIFVQNNDETNPYLWISVNGDLVYQEYSLTPLKETTSYQHEAVVVSATHDAGHAETYKFWKDISLATENLNNTGIEIRCDYQTNNNVGTSNWIPLQTMYNSPSDEVEIGAGEVNRIRYRLRLQTNVATTPPVLKASILKGYEVLPVKRLWSMRVKASTIRRGGRKVNGDDLYEWMWDACQRASRIEMETIFPGINNVLVKIEPPTWGWSFINRMSKWVGTYIMTVREM